MKGIKFQEQCCAPGCSEKGTIVYASEDFGFGRVQSTWLVAYCEKHAGTRLNQGYLGVSRRRAQGIIDYVHKHPYESMWPYSIQVFAFGAVAYIQPQGWETKSCRDRRGTERTVYCQECEEDADMQTALQQGWAFPLWTVGSYIASAEICCGCVCRHVKALLTELTDERKMAEERLKALGFETPAEAKSWLRANRDVDVWDNATHDFSALRYTASPWLNLAPYRNEFKQEQA